MPPPDELPAWARVPWPEPPESPTAPKRSPHPDPVLQKIGETHEGVQKLQVLLEEPDAPSKIDIMVDLMETIAGQLKALNKGLDLLFYRQNALFRALGQAIPPPPPEMN